MAVAAQIWGDATMGSVGSTATVHGSLAHGVVDDASVEVESLGLGVGTQVNEHLADGLDGLFGPSTEGRGLVDLHLGVSGASVPVEGNNLGVFETVLKVADSLGELQALNCASDVVAVLVVSSKVSNSALSGFSWFSRLS